jgi:hypothetical protein
MKRCQARRGRRLSGELPHATVHHFVDDRRIHLVLHLVKTLGRTNRNNLPWKRSRHTGLRAWLVRADDAVSRFRAAIADPNQGSTGELEEGSAFHKSPSVDLNMMAPKYPSSRVDARRLNEGRSRDLEFHCWGQESLKIRRLSSEKTMSCQRPSTLQESKERVSRRDLMRAPRVNPKSPLFRFLTVALFLGGCSLPLFAQRYSFKTYGHDEGLGSLVVQSILQDSRGFLWVATQNGIYRFDGKRSVRYGTAEGLPSNFVNCIFQSQDGRLWAGTFAAGAARLDKDRFVPLKQESGIGAGA